METNKINNTDDDATIELQNLSLNLLSCFDVLHHMMIVKTQIDTRQNLALQFSLIFGQTTASGLIQNSS